MHDIPRQKLRELIVEYGRSLCEDLRRCEALLKDHCSQYKREIFVLVSSMREGIVVELRNRQTSTPEFILLPRLKRRLYDNLGFAEEIAQWVVETWVWALKSSATPMSTTADECGDWGLGLEAYNQGDYATAFEIWLPLAEQGHADAQVRLGNMCDCSWRLRHKGRGGRPLPTDAQEAFKWYRKAAEQGNAEGQCRLGQMYEVGIVIPQDVQEAIKWYRRAAEQGNADGQWCLGVMCKCDEPPDDQEAVKWYRKAAEQGSANGQWCLGEMYGCGRGVPQDEQEAIKWYRMAAEQGNADTQWSLGLRYQFGRGVPQDEEEAVKWYRKAAEQGYRFAVESLAEMSKKGRGGF